jgi:hypothetical protein
MYNASTTEQRRLTLFTQKLNKLSQELGIVLEVTGGVTIVDLKDENLKKLRYTDDATSGDLYPLNFFED